jgi:hypothetical protein
MQNEPIQKIDQQGQIQDANTVTISSAEYDALLNSRNSTNSWPIQEFSPVENEVTEYSQIEQPETIPKHLLGTISIFSKTFLNRDIGLFIVGILALSAFIFPIYKELMVWLIFILMSSVIVKALKPKALVKSDTQIPVIINGVAYTPVRTPEPKSIPKAVAKGLWKVIVGVALSILAIIIAFYLFIFLLLSQASRSGGHGS